MNYIKVGDEWVNLDQVSAIQDRRDWDMGKSWSGSVTLESIGEDFVAYFKGDEAAALIAWLSVPAHMAGVIAPEDRDVMAWWQRKQAAAQGRSERAQRELEKAIAHLPIGTVLRDVGHSSIVWRGLWTVCNVSLDEDLDVIVEVESNGEPRSFLYDYADDFEIITTSHGNGIDVA